MRSICTTEEALTLVASAEGTASASCLVAVPLSVRGLRYLHLQKKNPKQKKKKIPFDSVRGCTFGQRNIKLASSGSASVGSRLSFGNSAIACALEICRLEIRFCLVLRKEESQVLLPCTFILAKPLKGGGFYNTKKLAYTELLKSTEMQTFGL